MLGFDIIEGKMAWRNLLSNKRRSLLTLVVIAIGVLSLLFLSGYINQVRIGFGTTLRLTNYGDFQIYPQGFRAMRDESSNYLLFSQDDVFAIEDALYNAMEEEIAFISQRLYLTGQISTGAQSSIFVGHGGDVYGETQMKNVDMVQGTLLKSNDPSAIVLGTGLAQALNVKLGTELILQVPQSDGFPLAELGKVVGIADFGITELNNRYVITDLRLAQALNSGKGAQRLLVHFEPNNPNNLSWDDLYKKAQMALEQEADILPKLELATWLELADFYGKVILLYNNQLYVFAAIFVLMFFFSISNSLYMSIMERQAEIGTLRAIGISRGEIVRVIFLEGLMLGAVAFALGLVLGFSVQWVLSVLEIEQPPPPGLEDSVPLQIIIRGFDILFFAALTIVVASCATLLPAGKAVRKNIVDAIRTV